MPLRRSIAIRFHTLACGMLVCWPALADDLSQGSPPDEIFAWPSSPRPPLAVTHFVVDLDGAPEKRLAFDCGRFALVTDNLGRWSESEQTAPRLSFLLQRDGQPEVAFGMAWFPDNDFLPNLDKETWDGYLASLSREPKSSHITFQRYSLDKKAAPIILDETPYRMVEYERRYPDGEVFLTREFFTFLEAELFVFVFSGPLPEMNAMRERQDLMISRMGIQYPKRNLLQGNAHHNETQSGDYPHNSRRKVKNRS